MLLVNWYRKISYLGVKDNSINLYSRTIIMANRVNMALCIVMFALILSSGYITITQNLSYDFYDIRLIILFIGCVVNLILTHYQFIRIMKLSTVFLPILILLILPITLGYIYPASFIYNHLVILAGSIIPSLIFVPSRRYWGVIGMYGLLMLIIDDIMIANYADSEQLMNSLFEARIFFKIIPFFVFVFLQIALFYMRRINVQFEHNLLKTNQDLISKIDQLKTMQKQLTNADKMVSIGMMSAGIAHEINTPLNYIQGGLGAVNSILKTKELKDETLDKFLGIIGEGVTRTSAIVKSLGHFSRGGAEMRENCNIHDIIDNCLTILNHKINAGVTLEKMYSRENISRLGNEGLLHQALMNLLSNAIQAMDGGGKLVIRTEYQKSCLKVVIKDNGSGIDAKDLSKIMDPFFTTKAPGEGTGLGLSITYDIIAEHGGNIKVESQPGEGTEFTVSLPVYQA